MSTVSIHPKGRNFVRGVIARQAYGTGPEALRGIAQRWGEFAAPAIQKAATSLITQSTFGDEQVEFLSLVREASILGRLRGLRLRAFNVRLLAATAGTTASFVGEGKAIPVTRSNYTPSTLDQLKVAGITVTTDEALKLGGTPSATELIEAELQDDLRDAAALAIDTAFLNPANAGVANERPAAITNGITPIASTGNPAEDIALMIEAFGGDLATAAFITDSKTAARLALARDAGGSYSFPDVGARGGSILQIPVVVSRGSPYSAGAGQIALVDAAGITYALDGAYIDIADAATIQMDDAPTSPPTASTVALSMWQHNLAAFKVIAYTNWQSHRTAGVVLLTGADYTSVIGGP